MRKVKVLIVDDSASVRQALTEVLGSDPAIEVMAAAADPFVAARHISHETPDVITLDIEMPRMDGITFLRKIMTQRPIPVVICSSLPEEGKAAPRRRITPSMSWRGPWSPFRHWGRPCRMSWPN